MDCPYPLLLNMQDFSRVVVEGDPPFVPPVRMHKPPLDAHMPTAVLKLTIFDSVTGESVMIGTTLLDVMQGLGGGQ